jgi:epoxyqueuosine reductase
MLDATRCISYLTIEHRGDIDEVLRPLVGDLLYGCDICQDVCPWNVRFSRPATEPAFAARSALEPRSAGELARELLEMTQPVYAERFRRSPMKRAKLRGLQRNAAVVLDNLCAADEPTRS